MLLIKLSKHIAKLLSRSQFTFSSVALKLALSSSNLATHGSVLLTLDRVKIKRSEVYQ